MIAREGLPFIIMGLILTASFIIAAIRYDSIGPVSNIWMFAMSVLMSVLTMFVIFFFRDPVRNVPDGIDIVVSPADGKVLSIEKLDNHPFTGEGTVKISIFLSVFDVHINRIPVGGKVDFIRYHPGKFFVAFEDKASDENEQNEIGLVRSNGQKIVVTQIAGMIARRIVCRLKPNQEVATGERFGMIRFGSRTELFLPSGCEVMVEAGDHVTGGLTVLAKLGRSKADKEISTTKEDNVEI